MAAEIEIKFRVADVAALERQVRSLHFQQVSPASHEWNALYDRNGELRGKAEVLRIRKYRGRTILTYKSKGTIARHKTRQEFETTVEKGDELDNIFRGLGYQPAFVYEKFRSEWTDNRGHVVIDQTPIGNFAELEGSPEWIDRVAHQLGIPESQYVTDSYAKLFHDWKLRSGSPACNMTFDECGTPRPF